MPTIRIHRLIDHPPATEGVAGWIDAEWGALSGRSRDETRARFTEDRAGPLPCSFVALEDGDPVGVASLRARDSVDWDAGAGGPWVCNVYVPPHARGQGIAGLLCRHLERHAAGLGFAALQDRKSTRLNSSHQC